jgi:hypothetical protein
MLAIDRSTATDAILRPIPAIGLDWGMGAMGACCRLGRDKGYSGGRADGLGRAVRVTTFGQRARDGKANGAKSDLELPP